MEFIRTALEGLYIIKPVKFEDERGIFFRAYCKKIFREIGLNKEFVQFNHSFNIKKGTVRGMHYQNPPFKETKLIRCVQGRAYDVAVDIRKGSPTYLQAVSVELSAENMLSVLIPEGFAHGFQTLEDNTSLIYHHTEYYTSLADSGLRPDDPGLALKWPLPYANLSEKDKSHALINDDFRGI